MSPVAGSRSTAPVASADPVTTPGGPGGAGGRVVTWDGMAPGVRMVVRGGRYFVDTEALEALAARLDVAAAGLETARGSAMLARSRLRPECSVAAARLSSRSSFLEAGSRAASPLCLDLAHARGFALAQAETAAEAELAAVIDGPGSLGWLAEDLRSLVREVRASADLYSRAEDGAGGRWSMDREVRAASLGSGLAAFGNPALTWLPLLAWLGSDLSPFGLAMPDDIEVVADYLTEAAAVLMDPALSEWVRSDLMLISTLVVLVSANPTQGNRRVIESYLAQVSMALEDYVTLRLPPTVMVGTVVTPTSELSPMQRVSVYLAARIGLYSSVTAGPRQGIALTPVGGEPIHLPAAYADPLAMGTAVGLTAAEWTRVTAERKSADRKFAVRTLAELMERTDEVSQRSGERGRIAIQRITRSDGTRSWIVLVPGTDDWTSGESNPQDLLTNLEAVAGLPTDMQSAVVGAMRAAGIGPGEEVILYGHSQGAMTATRLAADPAFQAEFHVTGLVTAGGPVAGTTLPANVEALHVENVADPVPALDGAVTPTSPTRSVVQIDTSQAELRETGFVHGGRVYAEAVKGAQGDPSLAAINAVLASAAATGDSGAVVDELEFEIARDLSETMLTRLDDDFDARSAAEPVRAPMAP